MLLHSLGRTTLFETCEFALNVYIYTFLDAYGPTAVEKKREAALMRDRRILLLSADRRYRDWESEGSRYSMILFVRSHSIVERRRTKYVPGKIAKLRRRNLKRFFFDAQHSFASDFKTIGSERLSAILSFSKFYKEIQMNYADYFDNDQS